MGSTRSITAVPAVEARAFEITLLAEEEKNGTL